MPCANCNFTGFVKDRCKPCAGEGGADILVQRDACGGSGQQRNNDGTMSVCQKCNGDGLMPLFIRCIHCGQGGGWVHKRCEQC